MARLSYAQAVRVANFLGNVTPEYVLSDQFTQQQANDVINAISEGESERLAAAIEANPVNWGLVNDILAQAEEERGETLMGRLRAFGQTATGVGKVVFYGGIVLAAAYAYSLVKR